MSRLMTYDEISETFGITRKSTEQLVKRKRWMRRKGNDGKVRIDVPEDALPRKGQLQSVPAGRSDRVPASASLSACGGAHVLELGSGQLGSRASAEGLCRRRRLTFRR